MRNDFRALCAELTEFVARLTKHYYEPAELLTRARAALADGPAVPDGREPASVTGQPSDEELDDWHSRCADLTRLGEAEHYWAFDLQGEDVAAVARAAIARWGNPAPQPPAEGEVAELVAWLRDQDGWMGTRVIYSRIAELLQRLSPPQPVPVSERLPEPKDCDAEGRCWLLTVEDEYPQWRLHSIEGNQPGGATMIWVPVDSSPGVMVDCFYTSHWLPAHALPLPGQEVEG